MVHSDAKIPPSVELSIYNTVAMPTLIGMFELDES